MEEITSRRPYHFSGMAYLLDAERDGSGILAGQEARHPFLCLCDHLVTATGGGPFHHFRLAAEDNEMGEVGVSEGAKEEVLGAKGLWCGWEDWDGCPHFNGACDMIESVILGQMSHNFYSQSR